MQDGKINRTKYTDPSGVWREGVVEEDDVVGHGHGGFDIAAGVKEEAESGSCYICPDS